MPDVIFVAELIDKLERSYNIDKTRIYANGMYERRRHGIRAVLHAIRSDRGGGNGFGWA